MLPEEKNTEFVSLLSIVCNSETYPQEIIKYIERRACWSRDLWRNARVARGDPNLGLPALDKSSDGLPGSESAEHELRGPSAGSCNV